MTKRDIKSRPGRLGQHARAGLRRRQQDALFMHDDFAPEMSRDNMLQHFFLFTAASIILIGVLVFIGIAYSYFKRPYQYYTVARGDIVKSVFAHGHVEPIDVFKAQSLLPDISIIDAIHVKEGDSVKAGDLLVEISDKILLSRIANADLDYQYQKSLVENAKKMYRLGEATLDDIAKQQERMNKLADLYNYYSAFLPETKIYSDRDGLVLYRGKDPDERVDPGELILWVGHDDHKWIRLDMTEDQMKEVDVGDMALVYIGNKLSPKLKDYTITGRVKKIVPPLIYSNLPFEPTDYQVYVAIPNDLSPPPGIRHPAKAEIFAKVRKNVPWIQYKSIYKFHYLLIKTADGHVEARLLKQGIRDRLGLRVEVISGVEPGETVLEYPQSYVNKFGEPPLPPLPEGWSQG